MWAVLVKIPLNWILEEDLVKVTYYESFWGKQAAGGEVGQEGRRSDEVRCQGAAEGTWSQPLGS